MPPESQEFLKTSSCQITNLKHFSLKNVIFYLNGGQWACRLKLKHFLKITSCQITNFKYFSQKNVRFYLNGGQGACFLDSEVIGHLRQPKCTSMRGGPAGSEVTLFSPPYTCPFH